MPYLVQQTEDRVIVYQSRDVLHWGPCGALEVHFAELCEGDLVHGKDFRDVALPARNKLLCESCAANCAGALAATLSCSCLLPLCRIHRKL